MIVVVFNIPMALLGSLVGLWLTGNTINIMTLGGLALSIGMLVDEATVSIENIHVQMTQTERLARAVERGSNETAVPRLLAMLCILSVFIPAFIMAGAGALAVHAAGAGGRFRDDLVVSAVQHAGADRVRVDSQAARRA